MTTNLLTPLHPHPVWLRSKIQCLLVGEEGEGGKAGARHASSWEKRRKKRELKKARRKKTRKVTQPLHIKTILQLLQNCIGPIIRIGQEIPCLPYAGFKKKL